MPWADGNLRTRSAAARRPSLFADSCGPEMRKHVQSGIRPSWYTRPASRPPAHADAPRREDRRHQLRWDGQPRVRLPSEEAGRAPLPSGRRIVPVRLRVRARQRICHGVPAHRALLAVPLHASRGGDLPRLSDGGRQGVHRAQRQVLQVHRLLEGLRGRGERREEVQELQALQGHLQPQVRRGMRPIEARDKGPIGTMHRGISASSCPIPPCGPIPSCSGPF